MKQSIIIIFGKLEKKGTKKQRFSAYPDGEDLQVVVRFDNGSSIGYCTLENLQSYVIKTFNDCEHIPDRCQY